MSTESVFDLYNINMINQSINYTKQYADKIHNLKIGSFNLITQYLDELVHIFNSYKNGDIKINKKTLDMIQRLLTKNESVFKNRFELPDYKIYQNKVQCVIALLQDYFKTIYESHHI